MSQKQQYEREIFDLKREIEIQRKQKEECFAQVKMFYAENIRNQ